VQYDDLPPVRIRYRDLARILVKGPSTGRVYEFSIAAPVQPVHAADAAALLASGVFLRE
jgi:hypothetical protein